MKKEFLEAGKIVGTHGVKGGMRLNPWSDDSDFLTTVKTVYTDKNTPYKVMSAKAHGNITLITLEGIESIEDAERLRNKTLFVKRDDLSLPEGRYFIEEIKGSKVFDADSKELLGVLSDVSQTGANDVWHIENGGKEYLVPAIESVIVKVDIEEETVEIRPLGGIFDAD